MENTENKTPKHFYKTLKARGEMQVSSGIEGLIAEIVFELSFLDFTVLQTMCQEQWDWDLLRYKNAERSAHDSKIPKLVNELLTAIHRQ